MKPSDLIALISFVLAGLFVLKAGRKKIVLLLVSIGVLSFLFSIYARMERQGALAAKKAGTHLTPRPSPTPAKATSETLKEISIAGKDAWDKAYPHGYIIFGTTKDGLIHDDQLHEADVQMDFGFVEIAIDRKKQIILIRLPNIVISYTDGGQPLEYAGNLERLRFVERQPVQSMSSPKVYFEVIDIERKIVLMGLK